MLRSDIKELLNDFEERMKFVNIIRSITVTRCPEDIRKMFKNDENFDILNNIIFMTLLFIKDRTLKDEKSCTISDVAMFLDNIAVTLPEDCTIDPDRLATYIVVNVFQNSGQLMEYNTYDSETETFKKSSIRLVNETASTYNLTDTSFDFLYRSKEIASEFDYSVTRFKLQECMRHKDYHDALEQSKELILKLRHMVNNFDAFIYKCKENVTNVTADEYTKITEQFRELMNSEYEEFEQMQKKAATEAKDIQTAVENGVDSAEARKNLKDLCEIDRNLNILISEQRALINKKHDVSVSYEEMLKTSFSVARFERLHFERDILTPMKGLDGNSLLDATNVLLYPLLRPEFERMSLPDYCYQFECISEEEKREIGVDLTSEDTKSEAIREKNRIQLEICISLFDYMTKHPVFEIKEYIESIPKGDIARWCKDKMLLNILFTLFSSQYINLDEIRSEDNVVTEPNGELNLLWAINQLPKYCLAVKNVTFVNNSDTFTYVIEDDGQEKVMELTNFIMEVNTSEHECS